MKAIETKYKGYRFRSRLEARWAVFFDALGLQWEYEPEGFDLGDAGWYLPDFRVTSPQGYITWYEVKANSESDDGKILAMERAFSDGYMSTTQFTLLSGDPLSFLGEMPYSRACPRCLNLGDPDYGFSEGDVWCEAQYGCEACDAGTDCGVSDKEFSICSAVVQPYKGHVIVNDRFDRHIKLIYSACNAARSARFEHGERG